MLRDDEDVILKLNRSKTNKAVQNVRTALESLRSVLKDAYKEDYSLDMSNDGKSGVNYFKEKEYVDKTIDDYADDSEDESESRNPLFDKNGSFVSPYKSLKNRFKKSDDEDLGEMDDIEEENKSKSRRLNRFAKSKSNGKNVLRNVDLSSEEFDSPFDEDFDEKYNNVSDKVKLLLIKYIFFDQI